MVKLIIAATVALVGMVAGGVAAQINAPEWLIAVAGMAGTTAAALGGPAALDALIARIPRAWKDEIVAYGIVVIGLLQGGQLAAFNVPGWLHVAVGVLVLLAGLLGIRSRATPLSNPRGSDGAALVPLWAQHSTSTASSGTVGKATITGATPSSTTLSAARRTRSRAKP